jgi:hypothetical protein
MKYIFTLAALFCLSTSFSQWTRVGQLPSSDISSLYHKDNILYAGGKNIIYISKNNGITWDSTSTIPRLFLVTSIIVYKNELYAAAPSKGVFKSPDGGTTWQDVSAGIFRDVADFNEFRGDLYAATLGNSVYKLNPVNRNSWLSFSNGLSGLSANQPVISSNNNAMIAGTLANGIYDRLGANSTTWEERLLTGGLDPNEGAYAIVAAHDTLFYSGRTGKFYMSIDNGVSWNFIGERLASAATSMVNARQALVISRHIFEDGFKTLFYYIKKDSLQNSFVNFSVVADTHFTYKIDILGNKLWDASNKGLFFMPLSELPGIFAADEGAGSQTIFPVHFISLNAKCQASGTLISWKTSFNQNSSHFKIERNINGVNGTNWMTIGATPAINKNEAVCSFSFTDNNPQPGSYYRIVQYDLDGRMQFSEIIRPSCNSVETFALWPNPFHDKLAVNINTDKQSQVLIKIINNNGALVRLQKANIVQGNNQIIMDMKFLRAGQYHLSAIWSNGEMQKTIQVIKL